MTTETNTTRALEPIGRTLLFSPAARALPTGIEWLRPPTEEELHADDFLVQRCGESVGWWTGDIVVALHERYGVDQSLSQFAAEYAITRSLNEHSVLEYAAVAKFWPLLCRHNKPATFTHHRLIWGAIGGGQQQQGCALPAALAWLKRAMDGDNGTPWSTGRLREELSRNARRNSEPPEPAAPTGDYEVITRLELWSSQNLPRLSEVEPPTARDILSRLASTVALIDSLRAKANG